MTNIRYLFVMEDCSDMPSGPEPGGGDEGGGGE
jgi:hypothetical protein